MKKQSKRDKLVALKEFADLETGKLDETYFTYENSLYAKAIRKKALDARIARCNKCSGLNLKRFTESCPGWGDLNAKIFFIGQSLHEPGVSSNLPFILGSGYSIDAALRLSGLLRKDVFFTNVIHCHPPKNRTTTEEEKQNCLPFLEAELSIVLPKLVVALGNDAKLTIETVVITALICKLSSRDYKPKIIKIRHPASFMYAAPEDRISWIVKLSLEMDKIL